MRYIKAPFNFVPVSDQVYFPYWADQISHDIPFSDGLSGHLEIELKAETPIFIRDSHDEARFCHITDREGKIKFFIPGTSLKGTIRSVLEILSFAKMAKINGHKYAIRDLNNRKVYNLMNDSANIHCGWFTLIKDENGVESGTIRDCGTPWRINHQQLDAHFRTSFVSTFRDGGTANFRNPDDKTARYKYENVATGIGLTHNFAETSISYNKKLCDFDTSGQEGTLVFTGQAVSRKTNGRPSGKFYEFVFIEPTSPLEIKVDSKIWKEFKFHYFDDSKQISADWKWRKGQLARGKKIPVFFRKDTGDASKAMDMGLAYLYKMPYNHSVKDLLPEEHRLLKPDLAECIFGNADENDALKGRVQFSTAWADMDTVEEGDTINTILGTPKASYYPVYLKQKGSDGRVERDSKNRPVYKTYMDADAELAGRKRYPVRETEVQNLPQGTERMNVPITPLIKGAIFTAGINYFNLRPAELGALLSALTFHNNASTCYHGLGMAKAFGFGRVALTITDMGKMEQEMLFYLTDFESEINAYIQVDNPDFEWHKSDQIKEFIAMAKVQKFLDNQGNPNSMAQHEYNKRMEYMLLPVEFAKAKSDEKRRGVVTKTRGFYLDDYCSITKNVPEIKSYSDDDKVAGKEEIAHQARTQLKEEIKNYNAEEKRKNKEIADNRRKQQERDRQAAERAKSERIKKEKEAEQERLDEANRKQQELKKEREKELEKQREEEKARIARRNEQEKKAGIEPVIREIKGFKEAKKKVEQYMKHIGTTRLDARDTLSLMEKASEWYLSTPDRLKGKRWTPPEGADWKKIASWIGDEPAKEWYKNLTGK